MCPGRTHQTVNLAVPGCWTSWQSWHFSPGSSSSGPLSNVLYLLLKLSLKVSNISVVNLNLVLHLSIDLSFKKGCISEKFWCFIGSHFVFLFMLSFKYSYPGVGFCLSTLRKNIPPKTTPKVTKKHLKTTSKLLHIIIGSNYLYSFGRGGTIRSWDEKDQSLN